MKVYIGNDVGPASVHDPDKVSIEFFEEPDFPGAYEAWSSPDTGPMWFAEFDSFEEAHGVAQENGWEVVE